MVSGDIDRLKHIITYCEDIADAVNYLGNSYDAFSANIHYYNSVSMCIMQIGELASGLSDEFKDSTREQMPWGLIRGMRNRFAHSYATMDKCDIWETASKDIPVLLSFCIKHTKSMP
jgi:uncharacterized protein with HEPN domain